MSNCRTSPNTKKGTKEQTYRRNSMKMSYKNLNSPQYIYGSNLTKKGVHSSIIPKMLSQQDINSTESCNTVLNHKWQNSSNHNHNEYSPIYTNSRLNAMLLYNFKNDDGNEELHMSLSELYGNSRIIADDDERFERIIRQRSRSLRNLGYYASNHLYVNRERLQRKILPLHRCHELDELATEQAKKMAKSQCRMHSDVNDLMTKLSLKSPCRRLGENLCRGSSVEFMHKKMTRSPKYNSEMNNMLDRRFSKLGVGVATSDNGELYMCQIYKG